MSRLVAFGFLALLSNSVWAERCIAIDGDTLVCNRQKVRLTNVYAAEMNQPGGSAAKKKLQALVHNREVGLVPHGHDRYGRILAEVYVDGRRIEQADIGPRAGRGSTWGAERHVYVRTV
ncbi:MAG TPA: thermonuclease family protein, partial [Burkholderiales bacterium]|nr:thermonuclease family protein [Burkholderiales bacterium]